MSATGERIDLIAKWTDVPAIQRSILVENATRLYGLPC
jgi:hypothetical protein